jgi:P4 family phage/plasmid primase-like protien
MGVLETENFKILKKNLVKPEDFRKQHGIDKKACFSYNYTKYGSLETWVLAWEKLKALPENENVFHELIIGDRPVKPYLDIEWYQEKYPELMSDRVIMDIKDAIVSIFKDEWGTIIRERDIYIASCHRKKTEGYKYSYRLIISTHPTLAFFNTNTASYLAKRVKQRCETKFSGDVIDMSVYKKLQNMRLIGHSKAGEYIPMQKRNAGEDDMEFIITNIDPEYTVIQVPEQKDTLYKSIKNVSGTGFDDPETVEHILEKIHTVHPTAKVDRIDNNFMQLNYSDRTEPCFCDEKTIHDRIGFFCYIQGGLIHIGCHSGNCVDVNNKKKVIVLGSVNCKKNDKHEQVAFDNKFVIDHSVIKQCVKDGSFGISNLFNHMYLTPKRILWINDSSRGSTFYWDGGLWKQDEFSFVERLITNTVNNVLKDFLQCYDNISNDDQDDASVSIDKATITTTRQMIAKLNEGSNTNNIIRFLRPLLNDFTFIKIKDISPYLLSCKNGVVILKTGEIRKCVPEDNMTKCIDIDYDVNADMSQWDNFVRQITSSPDGEDLDLYNYLRWVVGYAMQGAPTKKLFFILYGEQGYNGKSLFLNMIKNVMEFYAVAMDKSVVVEGPQKAGGSHSTEICQLENSRFGILSETKEYDIINDGQIKMLTGITDKLSVREIYGKQKEFSPTFVPFISSNHKLKINLKDRAMYERTVPIPFRLSFVSNPEPGVKWQRAGDGHLAEKFETNKEGILRWLVECSVFYHNKQDIPLPQAIIDAKKAYRRDMDEYADFIEMYFEKTDCDEDYLLLTDVSQMYATYCKEYVIKHNKKKSEKIILEALSGITDKRLLDNGKIYKWKHRD